MKFFHDEAVLLRKRPVGEKDDVVVLMTKAHGKMAMMAHGNRDPKSRKSGVLELFNTVAFQAREPFGKKGTKKFGMPTIQQVKILKARGFLIVEESLEEFYRASEIVKFTDTFLQELQIVHNVYDDLNSALDLISSNSIDLIFNIRLLDDLGYLPDWSLCTECHVKIDLQEELRFSTENRGFAHRKCCQIGSDKSRGAIVDGKLLKLMAFYQKVSLEEAVKVEVNEELLLNMRNILDSIEIH